MENYLDKLNKQLNKEYEKYKRRNKTINKAFKIYSISLIATLGMFGLITSKSSDILQEKENILKDYSNTPEYIEFYEEQVKSNLDLLQSREITKEEFDKNLEKLNDTDKIYEIAKSNNNIKIEEEFEDLNQEFNNYAIPGLISLGSLGVIVSSFLGLSGYSIIKNKISLKNLDRIRKETKICNDQMKKKCIVLDIDKDKVTSMHAGTYFELQKMEKRKEIEDDEKEY